MNIKSILLFVSGLVIGGAAGVLGTKKYFKDKYEKLYEEDRELLEDYYKQVNEYGNKNERKTCENCIYLNRDTNRCECIGGTIENPDTHGCAHWADDKDEDEDNEVNPPNETNSVPGGRMTSEERRAVKERLNKNWEGTNYAAMYNGKRSKMEPVDDAAESEHLKDQGKECEELTCFDCSSFDKEDSFCNYHGKTVKGKDVSCGDFDDPNESMDEEAFDEHQKNKNKPPKIISAEAYEDLPTYIEQQTLYFYAFDEMLTDENEEPVEEPERLIGDALTKYGFADGPERLIFVMNYSQDVCYEVQKLDASWTDTH